MYNTIPHHSSIHQFINPSFINSSFHHSSIHHSSIHHSIIHQFIIHQSINPSFINPSFPHSEPLSLSAIGLSTLSASGLFSILNSQFSISPAVFLLYDKIPQLGILGAKLVIIFHIRKHLRNFFCEDPRLNASAALPEHTAGRPLPQPGKDQLYCPADSKPKDYPITTEGLP